MLVDYKDALKDPSILPISDIGIEKTQMLLEAVPSLLRIAYAIANETSHDPDTNVGALLVDPISMSFIADSNTLTYGIAELVDSHTPSLILIDPKENRKKKEAQRPFKYDYMEHAERNVIYKAAAQGRSARNLVMIAPYFSCVECSRAIVQTGIKLVIGHKKIMDLTPERWKNSIKIGREIFDAAGVHYIEYEGDLYKPNDSTECIKFNGQDFIP